MKSLIKSINIIYSWYIKINNNSDKNTKDSKKNIAYSSGFACPPCRRVSKNVNFFSSKTIFFFNRIVTYDVLYVPNDHFLCILDHFLHENSTFLNIDWAGLAQKLNFRANNGLNCIKNVCWRRLRYQS